MLNKEILLKRLAIIKLIYKIGMEQSNQSESISFTSILSFHDSVEMFLKLAAEHFNIKSEDFKFMQYWDKLENLTLKESMRNLNLRRVNLKHKGLIPGKTEIEASRINTTDFFQQNTKNIFGIDFSEVSLVDLVKFEKTHNLLKLAENCLEKGNPAESLKNSTISFYELLSEYKDNKLEWSNKTIFNFKKVEFRSNRYSNSRDHSQDKRLPDLVNSLNSKFQELEKTLEIIAFGFDFRKYSKFRILTPEVYRQSTGEFVFYERIDNIEKVDLEFIIDFVIECALRLQEFDYENPISVKMKTL